MFDTLLHNFIFLATHLVIDAQIITKVDGRELNVRRQSVHSTILYNALFTLHNPISRQRFSRPSTAAAPASR